MIQSKVKKDQPFMSFEDKMVGNFIEILFYTNDMYFPMESADFRFYAKNY